MNQNNGNILTDRLPDNFSQNLPDLGNGSELNKQNYIPANDPTSDFLLDIQSRPNTDFTHNNMVPFFGAKVTQNMAGTGVAQGNYIDGVSVDSGFDKTTPYQNKLNNFTGIDDTYQHKREAGPMFSPAEQQMGWVFGQPNFRPDVDQYKQSLSVRNDLKPVEPEMVGPGLKLDPKIPAAGGFHEFTRVLPNNVTNYKANQLEGRVAPGKWNLGGGLPTAYPGVGVGDLNVNPNQQGRYRAPGVTKNRPNTFWSQSRYPTMTTGAGGIPSQEQIRPDYQSSFKPKNSQREQVNYGFGVLRPDGTGVQIKSENTFGSIRRFPGSNNQKFNEDLFVNPLLRK